MTKCKFQEWIKLTEQASGVKCKMHKDFGVGPKRRKSLILAQWWANGAAVKCKPLEIVCINTDPLSSWQRGPTVIDQRCLAECVSSAGVTPPAAGEGSGERRLRARYRTPLAPFHVSARSYSQLTGPSGSLRPSPWPLPQLSHYTEKMNLCCLVF